jgi:hypothetical protein
MIRKEVHIGKQVGLICLVGCATIVYHFETQTNSEDHFQGRRLNPVNVNYGEVQVRLSIEQEGLLKFEVMLGTIPMDCEVTANFIAPEINNQGTFYTDSNGLEMQRRELDKRSSF